LAKAEALAEADRLQTMEGALGLAPFHEVEGVGEGRSLCRPVEEIEVRVEKLAPRPLLDETTTSSPSAFAKATADKHPSPPQVCGGEGDRSAHSGSGTQEIPGASAVSLNGTGQPVWRPIAASCSKSHHYFFRAPRVQETGFSATSHQRFCLPSRGKNVCRGSPFHVARRLGANPRLRTSEEPGQTHQNAASMNHKEHKDLYKPDRHAWAASLSSLRSLWSNSAQPPGAGLVNAPALP
jgi:hypothetical protein